MALSDVGGRVPFLKYFKKSAFKSYPELVVLALLREFEKEKMLSLLCTQDQTNVNKSFHKGGVKATKTYFDSLLYYKGQKGD